MRAKLNAHKIGECRNLFSGFCASLLLNQTFLILGFQNESEVHFETAGGNLQPRLGFYLFCTQTVAIWNQGDSRKFTDKLIKISVAILFET